MKDIIKKVWHGVIGWNILALIPDEYIMGYLERSNGMPLRICWTSKDYNRAARSQLFVGRARWAESHLSRSFGNGSVR